MRPSSVREEILPKTAVLYCPVAFNGSQPTAVALTSTTSCGDDDGEGSLETIGGALPENSRPETSKVTEQGLNNSTPSSPLPAGAPEGPLHILWNHRWEHDKQPDVFFAILFELQDNDVPFLVSVGESPLCSPFVCEG